MVDRRIAGRQYSGLLPYYMGGVPHRCIHNMLAFNSSLVVSDAIFVRYIGQLFLGVISGPVEGILMIVGIFVISGTYGTRAPHCHPESCI